MYHDHHFPLFLVSLSVPVQVWHVTICCAWEWTGWRLTSKSCPNTFGRPVRDFWDLHRFVLCKICKQTCAKLIWWGEALLVQHQFFEFMESFVKFQEAVCISEHRHRQHWHFGFARYVSVLEPCGWHQTLWPSAQHGPARCSSGLQRCVKSPRVFESVEESEEMMKETRRDSAKVFLLHFGLSMFPNSVVPNSVCCLGVFSHSKGPESKWDVCLLEFFGANGFHLWKASVRVPQTVPLTHSPLWENQSCRRCPGSQTSTPRSCLCELMVFSIETLVTIRFLFYHGMLHHDASRDLPRT